MFTDIEMPVLKLFSSRRRLRVYRPVEGTSLDKNKKIEYLAINYNSLVEGTRAVIEQKEREVGIVDIEG
jgi:hypothetical protein